MNKAELEARREKFTNLNCQECMGCHADEAWNECAALLQGEIDSATKLADKNAAACELLSQEIDRLRNQLQSANAKLAVAKSVIQFYADQNNWHANMDHDKSEVSYVYPSNRQIDYYECAGKRAREALARIDALDASEGKGATVEKPVT